MSINKTRLVKESGLYLAATGQVVGCENPVVKCAGRAVAYCQETNVWLCQCCSDALHDARWGFGT
jgi:hypothetical protein